MKVLAILVLGISFLFGAVDINNASIKELSSLHGIGASKAKSIVIYRKGNCFKTVNELSLVKGIGKKIVEKNRADLKVGTCKK